MHDKKFNPEKLDRLNYPERLIQVPPVIIRDRMGVKSTDTILDIGAGTGFFAKVFAEIAADGTVYALDISNVMLDWLGAHIPPDMKNLIPMKMEENSIDLPDETADCIYMINLHHELDDPVTMLKECHRLLKPGGTVAVIDLKRKVTKHGPPLEMRCHPEDVVVQMKNTGFEEITGYDDFEDHFFIIGVK